MNTQKGTKEERFLITTYYELSKLNDLEAPLNREAIGRLNGLSPKVVQHVCNQLAHANFIKKKGVEEFFLTQNGIDLAKSLIP